MSYSFILLPLGTLWEITLETAGMNLWQAELHEVSLVSLAPHKDWHEQLLLS